MTIPMQDPFSLNGVRTPAPSLTQTAAVCGLVTAGIGIIGMFGLFLSVPALTGAFFGYKPVSFSAASAWVLLGLIITVMAVRTRPDTGRALLTGILGVSILVQAIEFPLNILGGHSPVEHLLIAASSSLTAVPTTPISPVASGLILPAGIGLLLLLYAPELSAGYPRIRDFSGILGLVVSFISFIVLLSYLYGAPLSYSIPFIPVSVLSVSALMFTGCGLMALAGQNAVPLGFFFGNSTQARLLRTAIPLVIVIIVCEELIEIILESAVSMNDALISALVLTLFTLLIIIVVGRVASDIGRGIDEARFQQNLAETELQSAYTQLAAQGEELRQQYRDLCRNQQDLMEREVQYRTILRTAMDGFGLVGTDGKFLDVNDAFCSMLGYTRGELLNLSLSAIDARETPQSITDHTNRIIREGGDRFETQYRCKNGRLIDAEVSVVYTGSPRAALVTFHRDITERLRAEKALEEAKKKLNLLNLVAFGDIRNATFTLRGYIQLLLEDTTSPAISPYIQKLESVAETISHSLEFAQKFQSMGMKQPVWQNVNLVFLMAVSHLDFSAVSHRVEPDDLEVFADPLLEQAFQILAKTSLADSGGVTAVSLTSALRPDGSLTIIYSDNGKGIPEPKKEQIFSRDLVQRSGMELFLAREILEITGMSISETGIPGRGLRFEINVRKGGYRFLRQTAA
jgi:PAS domain S-box-containing protein